MFVFMRALTYATLFIAFFLIYVPATLLGRFGIDRPVEVGWESVLGLLVGTIGAGIAVWCILTADSGAFRPPIPIDSGQAFQSIPATHSRAFRSDIPADSGHPEQATAR